MRKMAMVHVRQCDVPYSGVTDGTLSETSRRAVIDEIPVVGGEMAVIRHANHYVQVYRRAGTTIWTTEQP